MGSKLKMKAPKKNRALACDNQMSQAFGRAIKKSYNEIKEMQDKAYEDGFNTGDNWSNTVNTVTTMLALRDLYGFSTKRLLNTIYKANEYVAKVNSGECTFRSLVERLETETDVRIPDEYRELVERIWV